MILRVNRANALRAAGVIRVVALFDCIVTGLFALPFLASIALAALFWLNGIVGDPLPTPEIEPFEMMFINLMGSLGVVWAVARMVHPLAVLGTIDAWARLWVAGLLIYFTTRPGVPAVMAVFVATELIGTWWQLWALRNEDGL